jgi:hypothetical protein
MNRKQLDQSVAHLNERLNRPETAYTRIDGQLKGNVGHLFLDHAACYGGYRLSEMHNEGGGQCGFNDGGTSARMSNKEISAYLKGIHDALSVQERT